MYYSMSLLRGTYYNYQIFDDYHIWVNDEMSELGMLMYISQRAPFDFLLIVFSWTVIIFVNTHIFNDKNLY